MPSTKSGASEFRRSELRHSLHTLRQHRPGELTHGTRGCSDVYPSGDGSFAKFACVGAERNQEELGCSLCAIEFAQSMGVGNTLRCASIFKPWQRRILRKDVDRDGEVLDQSRHGPGGRFLTIRAVLSSSFSRCGFTDRSRG